MIHFESIPFSTFNSSHCELTFHQSCVVILLKIFQTMDLMPTNFQLLKVLNLLFDANSSPSIANKLINICFALPLYKLLFTSIAFLFGVANSVQDFTEAFYTITVYILFASWYTIFSIRKEFVGNLIEDLEKTVACRK